MFATRLISASILLPPVVAAVYFGSPWFDLMIAVFVVLMTWEWETICAGRFSAAGAVLALSAAAAVLWVPHHPLVGLAIAAAGGGGAFIVALAQWTPSPERGMGRLRSALWLACGSPYAAAPALALVWLRASSGLGTVLWLFGVVWATDIGAYLVGRGLGGPLLAPRISPKKTWSGAVGGLLSAMAVGAAAAALGFGEWMPLIALSAAASVVSQVGDLGESALKRRFGVKDSGKVIPGHGGVLDRVDGLVPTAPLIALLAMAHEGEIGVWG
ncbi:MAG: phosphatidate cytidylyltransferase [Alphaproteobacteria bacterium]|nr:phosphatidate cytidylyltransferase [Alphaproteobacteria bacterium]MBF0130856.1 phosphatidate cytidylyltransferase [Alphaproteobacteria bacterium]